jgi:hypothetical protein
MYRILLLFIILSLPGGAIQAEEYRLNTEEVKELISGNTVECYHKKKKFSYIVYYDPDGTVRGISTDLRQRRANWFVADDGYHCVHWSDKEAPICHGIFPNGDGTYKRKKRGKSKSGITMKRVEKGNPYNF